METTLLSLLPTYTAGAIPSALSSLAAALVAQSRTKASVLKPDEEVARVYTCCHLACERLKQRLNLPKIEPRPPCGPRVYKKLYAYLDSALLISRPSQSDTPVHSIISPSRTRQNNPSVNRNVPVIAPEGVIITHSAGKATPTRKRKTQAGPGSNERGSDNDQGIPTWLVPSLRHLCKKLNAPAAYPHVYTGILSVAQKKLRPSGLTVIKEKPQSASSVQFDGVIEQDWSALIIAILLIVLANIPNSSEPSEMIGPAVQILIDLKLITTAQTDRIVASVEELLEAEGPYWEEMDWFRSIAKSSLYMEDEVQSEDDLLNQEFTIYRAQENLPARNSRSRVQDGRIKQNSQLDMSLQIGLGTMMQDKVDWLNEERQLDFNHWKTHMLEKIELIEQEESKIQDGA